MRARQLRMIAVVVLLAQQNEEVLREHRSQLTAVDQRPIEAPRKLRIAALRIDRQRIGAGIGRYGQGDARIGHEQHEAVHELRAGRMSEDGIACGRQPLARLDVIEQALDFPVGPGGRIGMAKAAELVIGGGKQIVGKFGGEQQEIFALGMFDPLIPIGLAIAIGAVHDENDFGVRLEHGRAVEPDHDRPVRLAQAVRKIETALSRQHRAGPARRCCSDDEQQQHEGVDGRAPDGKHPEATGCRLLPGVHVQLLCRAIARSGKPHIFA